MYGPEYLDWKSECAAEVAIDAFLAAMEPEDRKWALAVLRKRHVTYRDGPAPTEYLLRQLANQQTWQSRQQSDIAVLVDSKRHRVSGGPLAFLGL